MARHAEAAGDLGAERLDRVRNLARSGQHGGWQPGQAGDLDAAAPIRAAGLDPMREPDHLCRFLDPRPQQVDLGTDQAQCGQLVVVGGHYRPRAGLPGPQMLDDSHRIDGFVDPGEM